jgi:hypothetical protein
LGGQIFMLLSIFSFDLTVCEAALGVRCLEIVEQDGRGINAMTLLSGDKQMSTTCRDRQCGCLYVGQ